MATIMTAMTSDLYSHGRFDPEYYLPNHTAVEADLLAVPTVPLRKLGHFSCSAFYPAATHLYNDEGQPFLRCVDIVHYPVMSIDQPFARIPTEFATAYSTIRHLKAGDIVISKVGTPCYASLLSEDMEDAAMTRTVLGMSNINTELVDPHYLIAFLRSRYGFDQLMRERELTIQYQLTLDRTRKVRVFTPPIPIQNQVGDIVRTYYQCLSVSKSAYTQAQQLLESELGLDKLRFEKPVGYTARFSELESSLRFDPEHFYPTFKALCASLPEAVFLAPLHRFTQPLKTGIQPTYLEDGEYEVINSKHIGVNKIGTSKLRRAAPAPYSVMADNGDVLLNATGRGTLGRCAVLESDTPRIFDVCIIRIRPIGIDPYFLSALLNTRFGQLQMELHTRGTSGQLHLYPRDARKILIWPAPESLQTEVRELMIKATRSAQEATQLLDQAKSHVEQLIEEAVQA